MGSPAVGALRAVSTALKPLRPVLSPISVATAPVRKVAVAAVTPVTDLVIDGFGEALGASEQSRNAAKAITTGAVGVVASVALVDGLTDPETWDAALDVVEAIGHPGADGTYAWSAS